MALDPNIKAALRLLAEANRLAHHALTPETAARLSIRAANGEHLGDITLSQRAANALADAVSAYADYAEARPDDFANGGQQPSTDPATTIDPLLAADFEEYCIGFPVDDLVAQAAVDPNGAVAAFDEIAEEGKL